MNKFWLFCNPVLSYRNCQRGQNQRGRPDRLFETNRETGAPEEAQSRSARCVSASKERRDKFPDAVCNLNPPACFHSQRPSDTVRFDFVMISTYIPAARSPSGSSLAPSEYALCTRVTAHLSRRTRHSWTPGFFFPWEMTENSSNYGGEVGQLFCVYRYYFVDIFVTSFRD